MNEEMEPLLNDFERIVAERKDWLFRFAYMRIGIREDAEDVVQDVLLGVFRRLREKTDVDSVEHYIIRAISNACIDYFRRKPLRVVSLDQAEQIPVSEGDKQIHNEFVRINRLLDTLPSEQSEIVRLKCYDDLTFKQIAELQGIPEATAKSRYRYAIMHIQQRIKKGDKI
ncbi:MAG: sigma-70 family RNA polymerase sigma factor [Bacteroidaceae bacterium]|nr:sigma-70 family RNA polymerase sigma factor [Bacteroidaceae bacterium]